MRDPDAEQHQISQTVPLVLAPQQFDPLTVRQLCIQLEGPNYRRDVHVLAVAQALCRLPVPIGWKHAVAEGNRSVYIDKRTGLFTLAHPSLKAGRKLLRLLRSQPNSEAQTSHPHYSSTAQSVCTPQAASEPTAQQPESRMSAGPDSTPGQDPQPVDQSASAFENPQQPEIAAAAQSAPEPTEGEVQGGDAMTAAASVPAPPPPQQPAAPPPPATSRLWPPGPTCMLFPGPRPASLHTTGSESASQADTQSSYWYDFAAESMCPGVPGREQVVPVFSRELLEECGLMARAVDKPTVLTFYSWWYEDMESPDLTLRVSSASEVGGGLRRYYCKIQFDIASQTFSIRTQSEDQELAFGNIYAVTSASSTTVDLWDLHVGATVVILGKRVTLLKADLDTAQWNTFHAQRLRKLKKELEFEVQKYKPRAHPNAILSEKGSCGEAGGLALKHTVGQINTLIEDLRQYRPTKADAYRARIGVSVA